MHIPVLGNIFSKTSTCSSAKRTDNDVSGIEPGKLINSGLTADVFEAKNNPDLVIRVKKGAKFDASSLLKSAENLRHIFASNTDESVTVMHKVKGEPLFGGTWNIKTIPDKADYLKTLDDVFSLPDSAFEKYIDDVEKIKKGGCSIDNINPNNLLLDKEAGEINIVDISERPGNEEEITIEDFYPFIDAQHLPRILKTMNETERAETIDKVKGFLSRISDIGESKTGNLKVPEVNRNELQDFIVYLYNDDMEMMKSFID